MNYTGKFIPPSPAGFANFEGKAVISPAFVLVEGAVPSGARVDVSYPDGTVSTHTVTRLSLGPDKLLDGKFASRCSIDTDTFEDRERVRRGNYVTVNDEGDQDND